MSTWNDGLDSFQHFGLLVDHLHGFFSLNPCLCLFRVANLSREVSYIDLGDDNNELH